MVTAVADKKDPKAKKGKKSKVAKQGELKGIEPKKTQAQKAAIAYLEMLAEHRQLGDDVKKAKDFTVKTMKKNKEVPCRVIDPTTHKKRTFFINVKDELKIKNG